MECWESSRFEGLFGATSFRGQTFGGCGPKHGRPVTSTRPVTASSCMLIGSGPLLLLLCLPCAHPTPTPPPLDSAPGEEWSAWTVCSATCGEGWQSRTRFCVSSSYSTQCSGPLREQRPCNNSAVCPGKLPPVPLRPPCLSCPTQPPRALPPQHI